MAFARIVDHLDGDEVEFSDIVLPRPERSVLFTAPDMRFASRGILSGDTLVVERGQSLTDRTLALLSVDGEPHLAVVFRDAGRLSFRGAPEPDDGREVAVIGVVSRVVRLLLPPFGP
jgi:hypothetical protein